MRRIDITGFYDLDCDDADPIDDELVHEEGGRCACNTANNANSGHAKAPNSSSINNYSDSRSGRPGSMHSSSYGGAGSSLHGGTGSSSSKRFTPDQQAVIELAKASKSTGLSASEAEILYGWAQEYGIPGHGPMIHHGRSGKWGHTLHIKIMNYHISIND